eukprot:8095356-Pyramimonas_sp.AAC.1
MPLVLLQVRAGAVRRAGGAGGAARRGALARAGGRELGGEGEVEHEPRSQHHHLRPAGCLHRQRCASSTTYKRRARHGP